MRLAIVSMLMLASCGSVRTPGGGEATPLKPGPGGSVVVEAPSWSCAEPGSWLVTPDDGAPPHADGVKSSVWWTGRDMLVWTSGASAAFRPCDGWRAIADPPPLLADFEAAHSARGLQPARPLQVGERVLFYHWDVAGVGQPPAVVAAIYDVAADDWKTMSRQGMPGERTGMAIAWTGRELLLWGGHRFDGAPRDDGALYDPEADRWRAMAAPPDTLSFVVPRMQRPMHVPHVWTGEELVVHDGERGMRYRPASDSWRMLSRTPLRDVGLPKLSWIGGQVVLSGSGAAAYDLASDGWRALAAPKTGAYLIGDHWFQSNAPLSSIDVLGGDSRSLDDGWRLDMAPIVDRLGDPRFLSVQGGPSGPTPRATGLRWMDLAGGQRRDLPALPVAGVFWPDNLQLAGDVVLYWGGSTYAPAPSTGCERVPPGVTCDPVQSYAATRRPGGALLRLR